MVPHSQWQKGREEQKEEDARATQAADSNYKTRFLFQQRLCKRNSARSSCVWCFMTICMHRSNGLLHEDCWWTVSTALVAQLRAVSSHNKIPRMDGSFIKSKVPLGKLVWFLFSWFMINSFGVLIYDQFIWWVGVGWCKNRQTEWFDIEWPWNRQSFEWVKCITFILQFHFVCRMYMLNLHVNADWRQKTEIAVGMLMFMLKLKLKLSKKLLQVYMRPAKWWHCAMWATVRPRCNVTMEITWPKWSLG